MMMGQTKAPGFLGGLKVLKVSTLVCEVAAAKQKARNGRRPHL
jgi:hypothetical protein